MDCTDDPLRWLFRVWNNVFNAVGIIRDREKEAPGLVDAGLPQVFGLVVLLGVEGWVLQVRNQKP